MTITDQPCEACGAIAGEECNPLCLGVAAQADEPPAGIICAGNLDGCSGVDEFYELAHTPGHYVCRGHVLSAILAGHGVNTRAAVRS